MNTTKLLIPLDGSEHSRQVLPHIRSIVPPASFKVVLLQVATPPEGWAAPPPQPTVVAPDFLATTPAPPNPRHDHPIYPAQEEESIRLKLEQDMLQDARYLEQAGFTVEREVRFGDPAEKIIDFVEEEGVALVAMATHGRTGLARLLMGSVTEKVFRQLTVPVLLVHPAGVTRGEVQTVE